MQVSSYGRPAFPSTSAGTAYFGVYGEHDTTDIKLTEVLRSNWEDAVLTKIDSLPLNLEVNPMFMDDGSSWYQQGYEPVRVPDASEISWFQLEYPIVPNESSDHDPDRRYIKVYYDDGTPYAQSTNIVFFGKQGQTN